MWGQVSVSFIFSSFVRIPYVFVRLQYVLVRIRYKPVRIPFMTICVTCEDNSFLCSIFPMLMLCSCGYRTIW